MSYKLFMLLLIIRYIPVKQLGRMTIPVRDYGITITIQLTAEQRDELDRIRSEYLTGLNISRSKIILSAINEFIQARKQKEVCVT